ncbi:ATP-binding cassette domain-containing protein, partial [Desertihabitans aurantiacus]|uniref:ATP-binding cassette domain-containing protein n=1 Tax=Desertihabitans aurantiacus TaxID=2282477 RepID=UPI000DF80430
LGAPGAPLTRVRAALDRAGAPDIALDRRVAADSSGLSAGEQRRIALARALLALDCGGAELLLLDEPTAGLDADTEATVISELRRLGVTVLVVSHRPAVLAAADRVVELPRPVSASSDQVASSGFGRLSPLGSVKTSTPRTSALDDLPPPHHARGTDTPRNGGGRDTVPAPRPSPGSTTKATVAAAAAALGTGAAAVALMATSAWLIARAAEQPPVLHLLVAVTAVRFFGLSRGVLRYLDRLAAHRLGLRHQARARLDSYAALAGQPMVGRRLGDLVARLVLDTEAAQDRVVRVRMPVLTAFGVGALAVTGFALLVPAAAVVLAGYLLLAGVVVPRLAGHVSARLDARIAPLGGELAEAVLRLHRHAVLLHLTGQEARGLDPARTAA